MMYQAIHVGIITVYLLCPLVVLVWAMRLRVRRRRSEALRRFRFTTLVGITVGMIVCIVYAAALHGRLLFTQVILTAYLATALMLLLQGCDQLLWIVSRSVFRLHRFDGPAWWYSLRAGMGLLVRAGLIFCVGLPYVLATVMTYRPRMGATDDPQTLYRWNFETVQFPATDGTRIVGWWIPAIHGDSGKTVLLCPGTNADMATQLPLVRRLVPDGFNVLAIDFRAHGHSGGQLCSFGDLERRDVLGAMRWLRSNHPQACRKVAGVGVSGGAAALLAAAADNSPEGQNIDAIAVYDTYDRLDTQVASLSSEFIPGPLSWFVNHLGLPMAGYQVGTDLSAFAPATQIKSIWPRPVLVIHGMDDEFVPFKEGQDLYDSASEPKMNFWIKQCGHEQAIKNDAAARLVRQCFDAAQRVI